MWFIERSWNCGYVVLLFALNIYVCVTYLPDMPNNATHYYSEKIGAIGPLRAEKTKIAKEFVRTARSNNQKYNFSLGIVNGYPAKLGEFPWQVGLIHEEEITHGNLYYHCGGSLITVQDVLTAGHCIIDISKITVVLGSLGIKSGGTWMVSTDIIKHDGYYYEYGVVLKNDIALIHLPKRIRQNEYIRPIRLPSIDMLNDTFAGAVAFSSGYGRTLDSEEDEVRILNYIKIAVISNVDCSRAFLNFDESTICTFGGGFYSICNGDSGGPLVIYKKNIPYLIGVVSYVTATCKDYAGYIRVTAYMDWIQSNLLGKIKWENNTEV